MTEFVGTAKRRYVRMVRSSPGNFVAIRRDFQASLNSGALVGVFAPPPTLAGAGPSQMDHDSDNQAKARLRSILTAPEAAGRYELAKMLAFETTAPAAAAIKILAACPMASRAAASQAPASGGPIPSSTIVDEMNAAAKAANPRFVIP
jgi:hypothetical protein